MESEDMSDNEHFEATEVTVLSRKGKRICPREEGKKCAHHGISDEDEANSESGENGAGDLKFDGAAPDFSEENE
jgi:hypothetical protein